MQKAKEFNLLWLFGALGGILIIFLFIADTPLNLFSATHEKPMPGRVFQLTGENLSIVKRDVPVLVALYTGGSDSGARMTRSLDGLAKDFRESVIVGVGQVQKDPDLRMRAAVTDLPAYVIYHNGKEVQRATGDNADLNIRRMIEENTGKQ